MDKQRFEYLNITLNQNWSERHDVPQLHFTVTDLKWLMEQASRAESLGRLLKIEEIKNKYDNHEKKPTLQ